ncbi:hypothetical protein [Desulfuromonas thiophila]|uniref:hypothetical protein n=1 Tax=Desulfuromonas thiophila TaxID=57664 RepID=UPI0029F4F13B|nr:hypothetical protein [Desulfuromonas thiophila]
MEAWPGTLPQSPLAEFEAEPRCGLADEKEERNPQRLRTYPERDTRFQMMMTAAQLAAFRAWWDTTLNQSAPFTAPWLAAMGYGFHFLRLREPPSWSHLGGGRWALTLPVEIIAGVETDGDGNPAIYLPEETE